MNKHVNIGMPQEKYDEWFAAMLTMGYSNFTQFVRDAIQEKVDRNAVTGLTVLSALKS